MNVFVRSLLIVLACVVLGIGGSYWLGFSIPQAALISLPIGFFAASLLTLFYLARAGAQGSQRGQLLVLLAIELVLVPIGSAAAIAAFFMKQ